MAKVDLIEEEHSVEEGSIKADVKRPWLNMFRDASKLSFLSYTWVTPLAKVAYRQQIDADDLWNLRDSEQTKTVKDRLQVAWDDELQHEPSDRSLLRAFRRTILRDFVEVFIYKMIWLVSNMIILAYLVTELLHLIQEVDDEDTKVIYIGDLKVPYMGFVYAALVGVFDVIRLISINLHWGCATLIGLRLRGAVNALVFEKLTKLRSIHSVGEVVNLLSNDGQRMLDACQYGLFIVSGPITLIVIVLVGIAVLGPAILIGFVVLILTVPVQSWIGRKTGALRRKAVKITDKRVGMVNEILNAVKLIKLYAWERSFAQNVAEVRALEIEKLRSAAFVKVTNLALANGLPVVVTLVTFVFHTLVLKETLTAASAFATIGLFNVSRFPLSVIPLSVRGVSEGLVAIRRFELFLAQEEVTSESGPTIHTDCGPNGREMDQVRIEIQHGQFSWGDENDTAKEKPQVSLEIEHIRITNGQHVALVGKVGSGKSSLLAGALCGDMNRVAGTVDVYGNVAYCSQAPWCFNGTIRENIIMGKKFDKKKFDRVVHDCALVDDLKSLPANEYTEIGERGINLSGGQKARISLARAVYADADIYLLDDVLSAVDVHVGKHIWKNCIRGILSKKTILMATHSTQFIEQFDSVIALNNGKVVPVNKLSSLGSFNLNSTGSSRRNQINSNDVDITVDNSSNGTHDREASTGGEALDIEEKTKTGMLIAKEDRSQGAVSFATFKLYFNEAGGLCLALMMLFLFFGAEGSKTLSDAWISVWTDDSLNITDTEPPIFPNLSYDGFHALVYFLMMIAVMLIQLFRGVFFAKFALKASSGLHDGAFSTLMRANMTYFDTTPSGRILNRFSGDIDRVDVLLSDTAETCLGLLSRVLISILVIGVLYPWFLLALLPMVLIYGNLLQFMRKVVRQMKRIESMSKSPLLSHVQSVVHGLTTLRSYNQLEKAIEVDRQLIDKTTQSYVGYMFTNRWLGFRLDFITAFISVVTSFLCVLFASTLSPGLAGLALTSAFQIVGIFQFATRLLAETEAHMTSVERLRVFEEDTPLESDFAEGDDQLDASWPSMGSIKFVNYSTRYQSHLPLVLKNVNFEVQGGQMCGIIGRTGCGKSTTMLSLFRIIEAVEGLIEIDGVDISKISLETLRSRLSIIPQDPTLFKGTVRFNVDPLDHYTDAEIWEALERVSLKEFVKQQSEGLLYKVTESGSNLSAGQRQLFCFARALLRKTKIIAMDEATSSIDKEMDSIIQATIRNAFKGHTLLVIAHRLDTVMSSDKIIVLDKGSVEEHGTPAELVSRPSLLQSLVHQSNESARLKALAMKK